MIELVETWLRAQTFDVESEAYEEVAWAVDQLFDMAYEEPEQMLQIVTKILAEDASPKIVGALGAGVIEDALVHQGENVIDKIEVLANNDPNFKKCLEYTYIDNKDVSSMIYQKFAHIKQGM